MLVPGTAPCLGSCSFSGQETAKESKNEGQELSTTVQVQTQTRGGGVPNEWMLYFTGADCAEEQEKTNVRVSCEF